MFFFHQIVVRTMVIVIAVKRIQLFGCENNVICCLGLMALGPPHNPK